MIRTPTGQKVIEHCQEIRRLAETLPVTPVYCHIADALEKIQRQLDGPTGLPRHEFVQRGSRKEICVLGPARVWVQDGEERIVVTIMEYAEDGE